MNQETLFHVALEKPASERAAFLDQACAGDPVLRQRLEVLLHAHENPGSFLEVPGPAMVATVDAPVTERPGTEIGPYKLLEQIGEGGFGVVFMAEQQQPLRRKVALKVLKPGMDTRQVVARFEAERQALALMDHANIAKVFDGGETASGRPYFVMELVKGIPITDYCDQNQLTPRERLDLFVHVCQAVQHAHQKGIIHRDVKPSNVLVTMRDGTPVVKVIDFGVAKAIGQQLTDKTLFTGFTQMIGTPMYMSPEQTAISEVDVDTRSDIYSLGVLLYELLTGTTPFDQERLKEVGFDELRRIIREEEPPKPSTRMSTLGQAATTLSNQRKSDPGRLQQLFRGELDWIVMKCVEKDRNRRYETANALAADVQRYLRDEAVEACPPAALYRLRKFARRHKGALRAATVVGLAIVLAVAALAVGTALTLQAKEDLLVANADLKESLTRERQNAYYQRIALAEREWSANNLGRMLQLLDDCPPDLRGWEWHYLNGLRLKVFPPLRHDSAVLCAVFSPDGKYIASSSQDGKVTFWDAKSGQRLFQFRAHESHARSVAFSPDGQRIATASWDKTVKIWDVQTLAKSSDPSARPVLGTSTIGFMGSPLGPGPFLATSALVPGRIDPSPLHTLRSGPDVIFWKAVFSPDGRYLATSGNRSASGRVYPGEVKIWDPVAGKELCTLEGQEDRAWSALAFSPDSQWLATGHKDNVVNIWDVRTGRKWRTFPGHTVGVQCVAFSPDGRLLASGAGNSRDFESTGEVKVWDVASGRQLLNLRGHTELISTVAFTPDGRLASGGQDQTIKLWDLATGQEALTLHGHFDRVWSLAFSPTGHQLVSASDDLTVRVWDATPLQGLADPAWLTLRGHQGSVRGVAFSPDGRSLASAGLDKTVKVWDAWTGKELATLPVDRAVVGVAFSPDGKQLASGGATMLRTWDTTTWKEIRSFPQTANGIGSVAFSPADCKLLAVAGSDQVSKIVWIIDAMTGEVIHGLRGHNWAISCVAFDPTGQIAASASLDRTVHIWDLRTGKELVTLEPEHAGAATSVAFSPDGKYLASGSMDRTVKIWNAQTWELLREIPDATGGIRSVAFAPDSRRLAWGGTDGTVKVADATSGQLLDTMRGHDGWINNVAFSPDGRHIASASADGTVKIWMAPQVVGPPAGKGRSQEP
jgi:WD40 repeat protein/serine/threonine protein kinase